MNVWLKAVGPKEWKPKWSRRQPRPSVGRWKYRLDEGKMRDKDALIVTININSGTMRRASTVGRRQTPCRRVAVWDKAGYAQKKLADSKEKR